MTDTKRNDSWLTVTQAAEYLNISEVVMRSRMTLIPGAARTNEDSGDWRVKTSMIDAWMAGGRKTEDGTR